MLGFLVKLAGVGVPEVKKAVVKAGAKIKEAVKSQQIRYIKIRRNDQRKTLRVKVHNDEEYKDVQRQVEAHNAAILKRRLAIEAAKANRDGQAAEPREIKEASHASTQAATKKEKGESEVRQRKQK